MSMKEQYAGDADKEQSPFDALFNECKFLREVEERLEALADRMCGPQPPPAPQNEASKSDGQPIKVGMIDGLARNVHALRGASEACMESLNRIERRL